jgi:hypothetical protein
MASVHCVRRPNRFTGDALRVPIQETIVLLEYRYSRRRS